MDNDTAITRKEEQLPRSIRGRAVVAPPVDIFENDDNFLITADLPGVAAEKVDIRLEQGELTIHGSWSKEEPAGSPLASEYQPTDFRRSFTVPDTIDVSGITAELTDGVLQVTLPKTEAVKPRRIAVKAG